MQYMKLILVGNLVRDPEMRYTPDGTPVTNFTVAVNDSGRDDDTKWIRVSTWRKTAKACADHLVKGQEVLVEGTLNHENGNPRTYTSRDGETRASFEVTAFRVKFGRKTGSPGSSQGNSHGS